MHKPLTTIKSCLVAVVLVATIHNPPHAQFAPIVPDPSIFSACLFPGAARNGSETVNYKGHHLDGPVDTGSIVCPDWFNNTPVAYTANGRCDVQGRTSDSVSSGNPRLYSKDITLVNAGSP